MGKHSDSDEGHANRGREGDKWCATCGKNKHSAACKCAAGHSIFSFRHKVAPALDPPDDGPLTEENAPKYIKLLIKTAKSLDSKFTVCGFSFGWDPLLGLFPVIGDALTMFLGFSMIGTIMRNGAPKCLVFQMVLNLLLDLLIGSCPFVGDFGDFIFKANAINVGLFIMWMRGESTACCGLCSKTFWSVCCFKCKERVQRKCPCCADGTQNLYDTMGESCCCCEGPKEEESMREILDLTDEDIGKALVEALEVGVPYAVEQASKEGGFLDNHDIHIPFPPHLDDLERQLRKIPKMDAKLDEFIVTLNRAAEQAATKAAHIFLEAIKTLNFMRAKEILDQGLGAATQFLEEMCFSKLIASFLPIITDALHACGVTKLFGDVVKMYNRIPAVTKVQFDLAQYSVDRAISGLLHLIREKENEIRNHPYAQKSERLANVFSQAASYSGGVQKVGKALSYV